MKDEPPESAVLHAISIAKMSPCAKSKRGATVYEVDADGDLVCIVNAAFNGPPGFRAFSTCGGSDECRRDCGKICMHAEERAIVAINKDEWQRFGDRGMHLQHLELVHVKVVNGSLVPGGGPSCWQCSRTVLDEQIGAVWLYEHLEIECPSDKCPLCTGESCNPCDGQPAPSCPHDVVDRHHGQPEQPDGEWRRYTAEEFHIETLRNCRLHNAHT